MSLERIEIDYNNPKTCGACGETFYTELSGVKLTAEICNLKIDREICGTCGMLMWYWAPEMVAHVNKIIKEATDQKNNL